MIFTRTSVILLIFVVGLSVISCAQQRGVKNKIKRAHEKVVNYFARHLNRGTGAPTVKSKPRIFVDKVVGKVTKWATNMSDGIIRTSNTLSAADNIAKFGAKYDMWKLPASHKQFQQKKPQLSAWMQPMPIYYNNINYGAPSKDYRESTQTGVDMYYPFQQMIPNYNGAPYPAPYPTTALNNLPVLPYNEPMMQNYMAMQRQMIAMAYYMHMQNNMPILPNHMLMMPDNNVHGEMAQNSFVRNNMPSNGEIESQRQKS